MSALSRADRRVGASGRGFTLLELVITALLLAGFVFGAARLIITLGAQGTGAVESLSSDRVLFSAAARLADDFLAGRECRVDGLDGAVQSLTGTEVQLISDADANGLPDLVVLRVDGGQLQRFVLPLDGCEPAGPFAGESVGDALTTASPEVLLDGLSPTVASATPAFFQGVSPTGAALATVTCDRITGCDVSGVRLSARALTADGVVLPVDRTWRIGIG